MRRVVELAEGAPSGTVRGERQQQALRLLAARAGGLPLAELTQAGVSAATVRRLAETGAVRVRDEIAERDPFAGEAGRGSHWSLRTSPALPLELTAEQAAALDRLRQRADERQFRVALLRGVTGSGKTEVYLRLAEHVVRRGGRVLILVPEIALTPAFVGQFRARAGSRVAVQHSGLSEGERHDQWHRIRRGDVDIVIGTRSAIFAPVDRLELIVVDEEHEPSYKQEETPRYHARDVAVMRGQLEGAPVVLGSATPSVESYTNALKGKYRRLVLPTRIGPQGLPRIEVVDRRAVLRAGGDEVLSPLLREALAARLARREQSLLLLNRRGWATSLLCRECGAQAACPNCSVSLTLHHGGRRLGRDGVGRVEPVHAVDGRCGQRLAGF
jgi:primosomal protein N' (replication factor Y)